MLLTSSTAFFLFFIALSTFPFTSKSIVQLKYPKQPVRRTEGQSLTLKCTAEYEEVPCGNILVDWCFSVPEECWNLIDPDRHLIQVNETKKDGGLRYRDVSITFTQLTLRDTGLYQCKAECQHFGASAVGHLINVTVTGQKETDEK
ncbi:uncharacterized protein zgc:174945 [Tachysurus fulvidraco]|uniref:uncharacterized protein zgc:174945 n=1 Tax=Tachysurus fulvidraco TaxID=1234273 RepID=UPI001FEF7A0B|nr:uncharacterized protein zgc:174945 [Tachysurus fulvidraco]